MKKTARFKILTITLFILACSPTTPDIDVSGSDVDINVLRLESSLFRQADTELNASDFKRLKHDYGNFFDLFTERIIAVGNAEDTNSVYYLNHFRNDIQVKEIAQVTLNTYPDLSLIEQDLTDAFKRYSVLFPGKSIPKCYSFISAFSYTIVVDDSLLAFGLDMYLGREHDYYRLLGIPAYKVKNMEPENIVPDCMRSWLATEFELNSENEDLLSHMIYHGKLLYAMDLLLSDVPDSLKIGFGSDDIAWVQENEKDMWFHYTENDLLFNKEGKQIQKYIGEAPFTPGFPEGSPGMTGRWIGWQIVREYMKNTDPLALNELFEEGDSGKILKLSKYKPT